MPAAASKGQAAASKVVAALHQPREMGKGMARLRNIKV